MGERTDRLKEFLLLALAWLFGVFLLVIAITIAFTYPRAAIPPVLMSALVLPPVRTWVHARTGWKLPGQIKVGLFIGLVVGWGMLIVYSEVALEEARVAEEQAEAAGREAEQQEALRQEFLEARDSLLRFVRTAISEGDLQSAVRTSGEYLSVGDEEMAALHEEAQAARLALQDKELEQEILTRLRTIPASNWDQNRSLYSRLIQLNPNEPRYKERFDRYDALIKRREEQRRARLAAFGDPPVKSAWDGTYRVVKEYLRGVMNDPGSLEMDGCTDVRYVDRGWLVGCDYRGRNAFGGMVRQSNWFIIVHGRVIAMEESSAYTIR